jgi:hypothetical protein
MCRVWSRVSTSRRAYALDATTPIVSERNDPKSRRSDYHSHSVFSLDLEVACFQWSVSSLPQSPQKCWDRNLKCVTIASPSIIYSSSFILIRKYNFVPSSCLFGSDLDCKGLLPHTKSGRLRTCSLWLDLECFCWSRHLIESVRLFYNLVSVNIVKHEIFMKHVKLF